jgi:hypothetical protein
MFEGDPTDDKCNRESANSETQRGNGPAEKREGDHRETVLEILKKIGAVEEEIAEI